MISKYDWQLWCEYDSSGNENRIITQYCFNAMSMFVGTQVSGYLSRNY